MPVYCFKCATCGTLREEFLPMGRRNDAIKCPECSADMARDITAERTNTPDQEFGRPIEMYSIAPDTPQEEMSLRRKCPDIQWDTEMHVPLARTRHEKLRLLKAAGFIELS